MKEAADCDRLDGRLTVLLKGRCRKSSWKVFDVELDNISAGGCCIVGNAQQFDAKQVLSLRFANFRNVDAHVRWIAGGKVGVEFHVPLKRNVIETLGRTYGITIKPEPAPASAILTKQVDPSAG